MHALLANRYAAVNGSEADLPTGEPFALIVQADRAAANGNFRRAVEMTDSLRTSELALDIPGFLRPPGDATVDILSQPLLRSTLHLLRAEWYTRLDDIDNAVRELRWHEHVDLAKLPIDDPTALEVDWALGTLARWRRAELLRDRGRADVEMCNCYWNVARLWRGGDSPFSSRAAAALQHWREHNCEQYASGS